MNLFRYFRAYFPFGQECPDVSLGVCLRLFLSSRNEVAEVTLYDGALGYFQLVLIFLECIKLWKGLKGTQFLNLF